MTTYGRIETADGYSYQITPEDVIWLARSVAHEGGNRAATIWTYFQRQAALRRRSSLASLVLGHSQPVNPAWRRTGEKCRPGGPYHDTDYCAERRLAARDRAAAMTWEQIPQAIRDVITAAVTARLPNPVPKATDFADARVSRGFLSRNPGAGIVLQDGNWYLYESRSANWPANYVRVVHEGRTASDGGSSIVSPALLAVLLGAAAGVGYYFYRRKKSTGSFFGVQEDVQDVIDEIEVAYHDAFWTTTGPRRPDPEGDGDPGEKRIGKSSIERDRDGFRVVVIRDYHDCNDLNRTIRSLTKAKNGFARLLAKYPDPSVFDDVELNTYVPGEEKYFGPDVIEDWEYLLDERIDDMRALARANGCTHIDGLRSSPLRLAR